MALLSTIKNRIKARDTVLMRALYSTAKTILRFDVPPIWIVHKPLHLIIRTTVQLITFLIRTLYWKPVFIMSLQNRPKHMHYEGIGLPFRAGPLNIEIGDDCRISARIALIGRAASAETPTLTIGNNVGIGWQCGIYVGTRIKLGNNVRLAENCTLSGYAGHPLDAKERAQGAPDLDHQARDIIIKDDVWLGRGVSVNAGVTIGCGTIVASGSVVTKDLPDGVLAAGVPAKIIRTLDDTPAQDAKISTLEIVS